MPSTARDARLDLVLTEREIIDFRADFVRILFIGDIVGRSGRAIVVERLPALMRDWKLDFVVINGENAAGGFGITEAIYNDLIKAGVDAVTLGNHAGTRKRRWFSSSARLGSFARSIIPTARRAAAPP